MSLKWYYMDNAGDIVEMVGRVQFAGSAEDGTDGLVTNAEEGTVGRARILVDDPDRSFNIRGHRLVYAVETEALADDYGGVIGRYYTNIREVEEGSPFDGAGRKWSIELDDLNTIFDRRIMRGSDANRDEETDVERAQWLAATTEFGLVDDITTYLSTADPVNMSDADYRNRKVRDIWDDIAQQSGKNWYLLWLANGGGVDIALWYGDGSLSTFVSDAQISNYPTDIAGGAYPPAAGSKLKRDPTRVYSGVVVEYVGGSVYRERPETEELYAVGGRDTTSPAPHVKRTTRAQERGDRYLASIADEEDVISTSIVVAAADVNIVVQGQLVEARWSWMPGHSQYAFMRALNRTVRPLAPADDDEGGLYEIAMELVGEAGLDSFGGYACTENGYQVPLEDSGLNQPMQVNYFGAKNPSGGTGDSFTDYGEYCILYRGATYLVHTFNTSFIGAQPLTPMRSVLNNSSLYSADIGSTDCGFVPAHTLYCPPRTDILDTLVGPGTPVGEAFSVVARMGFLPWSGHNPVGSSWDVVLTYVSGPDPRFESLPACPE